MHLYENNRLGVLTVSFVPSAENPKMALTTPIDPITEHTMIVVLSHFIAIFLASSLLPA
jgi:hypothetical protein